MKEILVNQKKITVPLSHSASAPKIIKTGEQEFEITGAAGKITGYAGSNKNGLWVFIKGHTYFVASVKDKRLESQTAHGLAAHDGVLSLCAPMPAKVFKLFVKQGDAVRKGQELVILEAMKMEHSLKAPKDGVVAVCQIIEGSMVELGQEVIVIE